MALLFPGLCHLVMSQLQEQRCLTSVPWALGGELAWGKRAVVPVCSEVENAVQIQVQSPKAQHRDGWRPSQQLPFALCAVSFQPCLVKGLDLLGEAQG